MLSSRWLISVGRCWQTTIEVYLVSLPQRILIELLLNEQIQTFRFFYPFILEVVQSSIFFILFWDINFSLRNSFDINNRGGPIHVKMALICIFLVFRWIEMWNKFIVQLLAGILCLGNNPGWISIFDSWYRKNFVYLCQIQKVLFRRNAIDRYSVRNITIYLRMRLHVFVFHQNRFLPLEAIFFRIFLYHR